MVVIGDISARNAVIGRNVAFFKVVLNSHVLTSFTAAFALIALMVGQSFWIMAISMIAINWLSMARRVRNMVFMFRDREYNLASRCLGTPLWRVLTKNILPYLVSVIILRMALSIRATINLESTLSYLGIGLAGVEIKDHIKYCFGWQWGVSIVCLVAGLILGVIHF